MAVKPIPEGYHSVTPYLVVQGANKFIDFLKQAFGAEQRHKMTNPDGTIMHAEVKIGDSHIMLSDANEKYKPMPTTLVLYVPNVDEIYQKALDAGGTSTMEPANQFYGDRTCEVKDPFGNLWWISTHVEDVPEDEMKIRAENFMMQHK